MDLVIRAAIQSDLDAVLAIEQASPTAAHWLRGQYETAISNNQKLFLVAVRRGLILGFVVASTAVQEWELENIAVLPSARRQKIGVGLMQALISAGEQAGAAEIRQEIRRSNVAAHRLGHHVGFVQDGRRRGYYRDPQEDALLFRYLVQSKRETPDSPAGSSEKSGKNG
ncbi:MAG TPA: ribosomal protein S18-alanine N-acetyltransferase [Terriglobales bacterium]|nr:ribosomal protein S18-alanine N-acetyltransferase [Terriglobales bacterium]